METPTRTGESREEEAWEQEEEVAAEVVLREEGVVDMGAETVVVATEVAEEDMEAETVATTGVERTTMEVEVEVEAAMRTRVPRTGENRTEAAVFRNGAATEKERTTPTSREPSASAPTSGPECRPLP